MKKIVVAVLACIMLFQLSAVAAEQPTFLSQVTCSSHSGGSVPKVGDILTFEVTLYRADKASPYAMFYYQTELYFETAYFELVEGSISIHEEASGFQSGYWDELNGKTMARVQMNYVDFSGKGTSRPSQLSVGTFQLKAVRSGTTAVVQKNVKIGATSLTQASAIDTKDCPQFSIADESGTVAPPTVPDSGANASGTPRKKTLELGLPLRGELIVAQSMLKDVDALIVRSSAFTLDFSETAIAVLTSKKKDIIISVKTLSESDMTNRTKAQVGKSSAYQLAVTAADKPVFFATGLAVSVPTGAANVPPVLYQLSEQGDLEKCAGQRQVEGTVQVSLRGHEKIVVKLSAHPLADVEGWYASYVDTVYDLGIMTGVTASRFAPAQFMTRAEAVTTLARMSGNVMNVDTTPFADVAATDWFQPYIAWAWSNEIVQGASPTEFLPQAYVTREQFATMLVRFAVWRGVTLAQMDATVKFQDVDKISPYAKAAVDTLTGADIVGGKSNGIFAPQDQVTRGECAKMLAVFYVQMQ